jgi:hypothetical protein
VMQRNNYRLLKDHDHVDYDKAAPRSNTEVWMETIRMNELLTGWAHWNLLQMAGRSRNHGFSSQWVDETARPFWTDFPP